MATGAGVAVIPWYATVFRGDRLEAVVNEIAPVALRYGATEFEVLRSREDRYRFRQSATFERRIDFERYWYGPEFAAVLAESRVWLNGEPAGREMPVADRDEVAVLPPVSGGG